MAVQPQHGLPPLHAGAFINPLMPAPRNAPRFADLGSSLMWGAAFGVIGAVVLLAQRSPSRRTT